MYTIKGNVVGGHTVNDLGITLEHGETRDFSDEVWERSADLKDGVARRFLIKVRHWIDRKLGDEAPVLPAGPQKAAGRRVNFAPAYQEVPKPAPKVVENAQVAQPKQHGHLQQQADIEKAVQAAVKGLIDSGALVPASNIEKKLDDLLSRPASVVVNNQGVADAAPTADPSVPVYIPSDLKGTDIKSSEVKVDSQTSDDSTDGAASALRNLRAKTPLRRPR